MSNMPQEEFLENKAEGTEFDPILPKIRDWPIAKIYQNKDELINEVVERTVHHLTAGNSSEKLAEEIARTYYSETQRIKRQPWKVDPHDETDFWNSLKKDTTDLESSATKEDRKEKYKEVIEIIVSRYTDEISATFEPGAYHFAKRFLSFGFASLLNAFQAKNIKAIWDHRIYIQDRIKLRGDIEKIRTLATKGTVVLLPTHFSNLDSILLGWSIHAMGLPAFMYGAGLNLYNSKVFGYFMNRLGAYKVDRRKRNPFYLETLKTFSTVTIEKGCHTLFFPGGTRSRSGSIESKLKLGLLGSVFDAQRNNIIEAQKNGTEPEKIFVVPLTMSYHFVLEAKSLIRQFLRHSDKEKYYFNRKDEFSSKSKIVSFLLQLIRKKSDIYLSYGDPIDLFGNEVDEDGNSYNNGKPVNITKYFTSDGELKTDKQRENVYTRDLGELVAKQFLQYNIVLSSHIVAFLAYEMLLKKFNIDDFYSLFEFEQKELFIEKQEFLNQLASIQQVLFDFEQDNKLKVSQIIKKEPEIILQDGVKNVGIFHNNKPLKFNKQGNIVSDDLELLYYYHNRMLGYGLEKFL